VHRGERSQSSLHDADQTQSLSQVLVNRRSTADGPRRLWVYDVTCVAAWSGFAYVALVTDVYSRRMVEWNLAWTLRSEILPMQALDMSAWPARGNLTRAEAFSEHGSNCMAMVYTDRVVEIGAVPSPEPWTTAARTPSPRPLTTLQNRADPLAQTPARRRGGQTRDARVGVVVKQTPASTLHVIEFPARDRIVARARPYDQISHAHDLINSRMAAESLAPRAGDDLTAHALNIYVSTPELARRGLPPHQRLPAAVVT
jgi:hypothetical protein